MEFVVVFLLLCVGVSTAKESYLHDTDRVHNREHIQEHMREMLDDEDLDPAKLSSEAMEFHYFKLHDYDNNNKLDGLELAAALTHFHEEDQGGAAQGIQMEDMELAAIVEQILMDDDMNDDGYIDYYEFIQAQRRNRPPDH